MSRDFKLTKSSEVFWRIKGVQIRDVSVSTTTDYILDTSISRTHSVDLSGMDTSFDENVNMAEVYVMFTPEIMPDNEVVVSVRSVPYVTKKGVYEIYVQTSEGKVSSGEDENNAEEIWTDEKPLVFEVLATAGSTNAEPQNTTIDSDTTPLSSDTGSDAVMSSSGGVCNVGLAIGLSLLMIRRKH